MKTIAAFAMIVVAFILASSMGFAAGAQVVVRETITITVDRGLVRTDVPPISVNNQTLVPIRGVFTAFGAMIDWFSSEKRVHIQDPNTDMSLSIGATNATVNGNTVPLTVAARIYRGRTMVPLRFIAETLGATVNWNPDTQTITILTRAHAKLVPDHPAGTPAPSATAPEQPATTPETEPAPSTPDNGNQ
jgi:hypothetical protein